MTPLPPDEEEYTADHVRAIAERLRSARTRGELGEILAREVGKYSLFDLQIIGGRLNAEIENLPSPYREAVAPFFRDQLFRAHHRLIAMHRSGAFSRLSGPVQDRERFDAFCDMLPSGLFTWDDAGERNPWFRNPKNRFFYYLVAAFTMFVVEEPGHPVGMPFPGGFTVEQRGSDYYCLIRDKEKDVFYSICNFCPAKQSEEPARDESRLR